MSSVSYGSDFSVNTMNANQPSASTEQPSSLSRADEVIIEVATNQFNAEEKLNELAEEVQFLNKKMNQGFISIVLGFSSITLLFWGVILHHH